MSEVKKNAYPPGPSGLPLLGNAGAYASARNPAEYLRDLRATWGDVFTIWLGSSPTVILSGLDTMKEAFITHGDVLNERTLRENPIQDLQNQQGLVNERNGKWRILKDHAIPFFNSNEGVCARKLEDIVSGECTYLMETLETKVGQPFNPFSPLLEAATNVITEVCFATRLAYGSKELANVRVTDYILARRKAELLPFIKHLPFDPFGYRAARGRFEEGVKWMKDQVESHRHSMATGTPRDYVDSFLQQAKALEGDVETPFNEGNLVSTVMNLYVTGTITVASSIYFGFLYLLLDQTALKRVQQEIDDILGKRPPQYADRDTLHYMQAVIHETVRKSSVAIHSIDHCPVADIVIKGKMIPKGTRVISNVWGAGNDEKVFPDPDKFQPERFLDEGNRFLKHEGFVSFGVGERICLGDELTLCEMFIVMTTVLQRYNITSPKGVVLRDLPRLEFLLNPEPFDIILTKRDA